MSRGIPVAQPAQVSIAKGPDSVAIHTEGQGVGLSTGYLLDRANSLHLGGCLTPHSVAMTWRKGQISGVQLIKVS